MKTQRYNLTVPESVDREIKILAEEREEHHLMTLKEIIKVGLTLLKAVQNPETKIFIREGDREREILFL